MPLRAVIIEDEIPARELLKILLDEICPGEVDIVGEGGDLDGSLEAIRSLKPDVVFLDIQLDGCTGFDVLNTFEEGERTFELIVVTQWPEYARAAIEENIVGFLEKPLDIDKLALSVRRATKNKEKETALQRQEKNRGFLRFADSWNSKDPVLPVPYQHRIIFLRLGEIIYCQSDNNYSMFFMLCGEPPVIRSKITMGTYEDLFVHYGFIRIGRSYLVNSQHFGELIPAAGDTKARLVMKKGLIVELSDEQYRRLVKVVKDNFPHIFRPRR